MIIKLMIISKPTQKTKLILETWNNNEATAVRVVRLRTSDLSIVWSTLIQSDAPYTGIENSNGQLIYYNGVVYLSVVADKELYYAGLELTETPKYSLNLIALNADGEDDGNGNNNGNGLILAHKSWATGPVHATDDREDPYLANIELTISSTGWLHLAINAKQSFVSTAQIGRFQTLPYNYYINYMLMKTSLDATSIPLSTVQTGISRNNVTEIVADFDNNIQWDDSYTSTLYSGFWSNADSNCNSMTLGGYDNWRLATVAELSIADHIPLPGTIFWYFFDPAEDVPFWTSEPGGTDVHGAVVIGSWSDGFSDNTSLHYRCIRTMP